MDLGLAQRAFIVTGGARGLGRAAAELLLAEGADVLISSRDPGALGHAAAELGPGCAFVAADLADPLSAERLVAAAIDRFGRLDGAVISTGGPPAGDLDHVADDQWREAFDSVFLGPLRLARAVLRGGRPGAAAVAVVLSTTVRQPIAGLSISNGLRPGLAMAIKDLADLAGPSGGRAVGLLPGVIATDRLRDLGSGPGATVALPPVSAIPLRRYGEPDEFARVAAFAVSPAASYLTGCLIPVDGGSVRSL